MHTEILLPVLWMIMFLVHLYSLCTSEWLKMDIITFKLYYKCAVKIHYNYMLQYITLAYNYLSVC